MRANSPASTFPFLSLSASRKRRYARRRLPWVSASMLSNAVRPNASFALLTSSSPETQSDDTHPPMRRSRVE